MPLYYGTYQLFPSITICEKVFYYFTFVKFLNLGIFPVAYLCIHIENMSSIDECFNTLLKICCFNWHTTLNLICNNEFKLSYLFVFFTKIILYKNSYMAFY